MPGRFIRVRKMRESEADCGDMLALAAAMQIMGASYVETLETKGTDGSNVHLGGPATITGYFGGIGQPNDHVLKWVDEYLYYYTTYGMKQALNINPGTVLAGYLLHKLGIDNEFKISVFMGNDNPYATLWTLIGAKLFAREDGTCPLIGFNLSNSVNNETIEITAEVRRALGFEDVVRIEHHITEAYRSVVIQPYNRRAELMALADHVPNISAKHEGGDPDVEQTREHSSDILDYFRDKSEIEAAGDMPHLLRNYLDKHESVNRTARALTEHGLSFVAARELHHRMGDAGTRRRGDSGDRVSRCCGSSCSLLSRRAYRSLTLSKPALQILSRLLESQCSFRKEWRCHSGFSKRYVTRFFSVTMT